ncbi:hypothetical protein [Nonomuraea roseola]|uniref:Uncharacterized protein n=1 Tax=Nonomuraea roseola TaxID=46179 RepID=A0ABV5PR91_9ACTN
MSPVSSTGALLLRAVREVMVAAASGRSRSAMAWSRGETLCGGQAQAAFASGIDGGSGQRVFAGVLGGCGQDQQGDLVQI